MEIGEFFMKDALEELTDLLKTARMNDSEINMLLGRFLEEEAYDYVECMELIKEKMQTNKTYS